MVVAEPEMLPPSLRFVWFCCHWQAKGAVPETVTLKLAGLPLGAVKPWGWVVIMGGETKVSVATVLVTQPQGLLMMTV